MEVDLLIDSVDDYNSWQENFWGRWKRKRLDKDVILAEGTYIQTPKNAEI